MFEVKDLVTRYGPVTALNGVSFAAPQGKVTAVLGANGAGKTTLLRTVSGLVKPESGQVLLAGRDVTGTVAEVMSGLGMSHVPEGRGAIAELTIEENLRLGAMGRRKGAEKVPIERVYDMFPILGHRRAMRAHQLSGGERQMLVVGRALMAAPQLLVLDEPSLGLAPRIVAQIFQMLRDLVDTQGLTVLLVEQNARSALSIADLGVVLNLGRVVVTDAAAKLAADEQLRHAYLGF
ncbi:ABC transporter ATP-binding protein [Dactylosporangium sp. CA-092794]|uniref:ABC transporter ATP-binding protein n=1 Tax=Dactylosporangium sp. CA-092794 TaxID=3239929 RepID=UPI003D90A7F7